jgi:hypothetical protein
MPNILKTRSELAKLLLNEHECAIAGDQHAAALVAPRHQLKERMCGIGLERQVAEFVNNQSGDPRSCPHYALWRVGDQRWCWHERTE